jgi:DNA-binding response OmpR family regulator
MAAEHSGGSRKLLIVDDEQKICNLLEEYFSLKGYEVRTVHRGEEAVVLAGVFHPDVVLLDLMMPGMSGVDTLKALKRCCPAPKVLMLSAADHEDVARGAIELGADFFICKPPQLSQLEQLVNGVCPPREIPSP